MPGSPCERTLFALLDGLREAAPRLNGELPFPQRTGVAGVTAGAPRTERPDACSAPLTLHVGGAEKAYTVVVGLEGDAATASVHDEADFRASFPLHARIGAPPPPQDVRALYDALQTDLAAHFGAES